MKTAAPASSPSAPAPARAPALDVRSIDVAALEHEPVPRVEQELRIFIRERAFDRVVERGGADTSREIGGVLVGVVQRDESGPYVRVDGTIDALHAEEKGAELTFTHATWDHIHEQMDSVHQGQRVVGWYHTHPGFGVFLSDRDTFIHRSFFDLPFQLALVYDPRSREHGVFVWRDNQPLRCRRYWIGAHEHHWDGARASEATSARGHAELGHAKARPPGGLPDGRPRVSMDTEARGIDWLTLAVAGLMLVCVAGLGGWWLGARAAGDVLARAEAELTRARERAALESLGDAGARRRSEDARDLGTQRNALGTLYADLAGDFLAGGDSKRARRYLLTAAAVDPDNAARYQKQLRALDERTQIRRPQSGAGTTSQTSDARGTAP